MAATCSWASFRDAIRRAAGQPGEGIHRYRLGSFALVDALATVLVFGGLYYWFAPRCWGAGHAVVYALLIVLLAIAVHMLFGVHTPMVMAAKRVLSLARPSSDSSAGANTYPLGATITLSQLRDELAQFNQPPTAPTRPALSSLPAEYRTALSTPSWSSPYSPPYNPARNDYFANFNPPKPDPFYPFDDNDYYPTTVSEQTQSFSDI